MPVVPFTARPRPSTEPDSATALKALALPIVGRLFGEDVELYVSAEELARLVGGPFQDRR